MSTATESRLPTTGTEWPDIPIRGSKKDSLLVEGSALPPDLKGIVDLKDSVDTTVHTEILPAVTHEHVTPTARDETKEVIIREIHNYHIFHRIQPIIDVEVLPAKHFIQNPDGTLKEVPASEIPGRPQTWHFAAGPGPAAQTSTTTTLEEAAARPSGSISTLIPRSSRGRKPIKQSYKELPSTDGVHRTETTWVHPIDVLPPKWEGDEGIFDLEDNVDYDRHSSEQTQHLQDTNTLENHNVSEQETEYRSSHKTSDTVRAMKGRAMNSLRKMRTKLNDSRQEDNSVTRYPST